MKKLALAALLFSLLAAPASAWRPQTELLPAPAPTFADVPYGTDSPSQVMDIYLPEQADAPAPLIVFFHGGAFRFGDHRLPLTRPVIAAGTARGYAVASADYRKSTEATFPAAVADAKAAVRYLKERADRYGIDPENITVWGESAGGYLAVMTALTPHVPALGGDSEGASVVRALVAFYPPVDFNELDADFAALGIASDFAGEKSFESQFLGQPLGQDKDATAATWWKTYADALPNGFALRAWIQAGTDDATIPHLQSRNFAGQLAECIGEGNVAFSLIDGAKHEDPAFYTDGNLAAVFDFLEQ